MDKKFYKFTGSHQKFWNEIHIEIAVASILSKFLFCRLPAFEFFEQVGKIQRRGFGAVEVVPVNVKNLPLSSIRK